MAMPELSVEIRHRFDW